MKKNVWLLLCLYISISNVCSAQISFTWAEFFRQKKTEIKYQIDNSLNLQLYLGLLKKGYEVVQEGSRLVQLAKNGELNLHTLFYESLKMVSPTLRKYPAVGDLLEDNTFIIRRSNELLALIKDYPWLTEEEGLYIKDVLGRLRKDIEANTELLVETLTNFGLEFSTEDRMARINGLASYAHERAVFIQQFSGQAVSLVGSRMADQAELAAIRNRYGIK